ncbi:MAG: T9SS type A sorting domain-containing protein [Candidatus Kapabacteria bacterium]|nr:T9SS type A sorting domain-containing protein [Candidatus Kapabacteria bacterium]
MYRSLLITFIACIILVTTANSQNWVKLRDIPVGLSFPVVVELNKEIHVIGGGATGGATDIHLRYKPTTDTWDTLAPVPYKAQQPSGVVLNGKIHYFGGGYPNSGKPLSSHYAYDPASNTWTQAAALPIARVIMRAAVLNGKLYALSGQPDKARMDEYNPQSNTWTKKNDLPDNNFWYSAIVVLRNEMYRFAGGGFRTPMNFMHKYNSATDSWENIGILPFPLHAPAATVLGSLIYITGGFFEKNLTDAAAYNPVDQSFSAIPLLPIGRSYHEMVTIDSCIYSVGGNDSLSTSLIKYCVQGTVDVYDAQHSTILTVFPSITSSDITIENIKQVPYTLHLYDIAGVELVHHSSSSSVSTLSLQHLPEGMYIYRMYRSDTNTPSIGKITIVR